MKKYVWNALTALGGSAIEVKDGYALFEVPLTEQCMNQQVSITLALL
ncbi:MAG: hypothetical protein IPJ49_23175 [Candidatus Obscuribacter sp.]|nr:hypothetical protein [Candidatus Obscuribacter sp.]